MRLLTHCHWSLNVQSYKFHIRIHIYNFKAVFTSGGATRIVLYTCTACTSSASPLLPLTSLYRPRDYPLITIYTEVIANILYGIYRRSPVIRFVGESYRGSISVPVPSGNSDDDLVYYCYLGSLILSASIFILYALF